MSQVLNIKDICQLIPQRKHLLMVDRAEIINNNQILGIKNATSNEPHFLGHFPNMPIMPGILQFEIMLQLANILYSKTKGIKTFLCPQKINKIRFKTPVIPGDQIIADVFIKETDQEINVKAVLKINEQICSQGSFTIAENRPQAYTRNSLLEERKTEYCIEKSLNSSDIAKILPHTYPFNFVDSLLEISPTRALGKKLISFNEKNCLVDKDGNYYLPHSHIIEAAAQVACVHLLSDPANKNKIALFLSVENCTIDAHAVPGDELIFDIKPLFLKTRLGRCSGDIYCGAKKIMSLEIAFGIVDKA